MTRKYLIALVLGSVGIFSGQVFADTVYIKDTIRVAVRTEPNNIIAPIAVVSTGMKLEVLEREDDFVKIKTPKGIEGWVKSTYITDSVPAMLQLKQVKAEFETIQSRLKEQETQLKAAELTNGDLSEEVQRLKQENAEMRIKLHDDSDAHSGTGHTVFWNILLVIIAVSGAFALGVYWYRRKIMQRLGGMSL